MEKKAIDIRQAIRNYRKDYDIIQIIPCSEEVNKKWQKVLEDGGSLPKNIHPYTYEDKTVSNSEFYIVYEPDLSETEIQEYLTYRKLNYLKTIKNCVVFLTVLTIISVVACGIIGLSIFG